MDNSSYAEAYSPYVQKRIDVLVNKSNSNFNDTLSAKQVNAEI